MLYKEVYLKKREGGVGSDVDSVGADVANNIQGHGYTKRIDDVGIRTDANTRELN